MRLFYLFVLLLFSTANSNLSGITETLKESAITKIKCVILGAGPTGLSAAYHLDSDTCIIEKNATVGGGCRSIQDKGFTFDYAGHIIFSNDQYVKYLYKILLGDNIHWQNREAWIYSKGVYTRYPFQGSLYGLPPEIIKECLVGAMEALMGNEQKVLERQKDNLKVSCHKEADCCADGTSVIPQQKESSDLTPCRIAQSSLPNNFEDFIYNIWGKGIAKHFAIPYNQKLWTLPLNEIETSWIEGRVPLPNLEEIIQGAIEPSVKPMGPNAQFGYPLKGGFQALMFAFLPHIKGSIKLKTKMVEISLKNQIVTLDDGTSIAYENLISTIPLPELIKCIGDEAPIEIQKAAESLKFLSVRCVNLGIARSNLTEKHWIYYPEESIFHRIFIQGNASPECNPPGGFGITCEISYSPWKPLPEDDEALIERCIQDCIKVGVINCDDEILTANQIDIPYAYVVYDYSRKKNVEAIKEWLATYHIILAGRYSEWEYYNSDHAFLAGKRAAKQAAFKEMKIAE